MLYLFDALNKTKKDTADLPASAKQPTILHRVAVTSTCPNKYSKTPHSHRPNKQQQDGNKNWILTLALFYLSDRYLYVK